MNEGIAAILKDKIKEVSYADKVVGLVRSLKMDVKDENNTVVQKTFPIASDCACDNLYRDLVPNSKYRSILYFEDNGVNIAYRDRDWIGFTSRLNLVGWLNVPKIYDDSKTGSTKAILEIIKLLPGDHFSVDDFREIRITAISEVPKTPGIFSRYSYDEIKTQYLVFPFDYFSLALSVEFRVNLKCI